jgi:ribosomal protein S18 acetylase RimI-like enzyme
MMLGLYDEWKGLRLNIKIAASENIDELMKLYSASVTVTKRIRRNSYLEPVRKPDRQFLEYVIRGRDEDFILIRDCDKMIGFALVMEKTFNRIYESGKRVLYIADLFVVPSYRRKGVGSQLLAEAKRWGRRRNLTEIEVRVSANNKPAMRFYEKHRLYESAKTFLGKLDTEFE